MKEYRLGNTGAGAVEDAKGTSRERLPLSELRLPLAKERSAGKKFKLRSTNRHLCSGQPMTFAGTSSCSVPQRYY